MKDTLKVLLGIPSGDKWDSDFGMCIARFMAYRHRAEGYKNVHLLVNNIKGSILSRQRHMLVTAAQAQDCDYILFIDSDQKFPEWTLEHLLARKKWVVGANIATRIFPSKPTARVRSKKHFAGDPVYTTPLSPPMEKVWALGTGVLLVNMKVFQKIPPPWFEIRWVEELQDYRGEDWTFMDKLGEAGISVWVDHELSAAIGHIGQFIYGHDTVEVAQEDDPMKTMRHSVRMAMGG